MKLAVVTPLPPAATGIAEYSAELLPALAAEGRARDPEFELAVFSPQAGRAELADGLEVEALEKLEARHGRGPFHLVVYQLGNDAPTPPRRPACPGGCRGWWCSTNP